MVVQFSKIELMIRIRTLNMAVFLPAFWTNQFFRTEPNFFSKTLLCAVASRAQLLYRYTRCCQPQLYYSHHLSEKKVFFSRQWKIRVLIQLQLYSQTAGLRTEIEFLNNVCAALVSQLSSYNHVPYFQIYEHTFSIQT